MLHVTKTLIYLFIHSKHRNMFVKPSAESIIQMSPKYKRTFLLLEVAQFGIAFQLMLDVICLL